MLFGPEKVIACPHCGALARVFTLRSGNTFGALTWSDGKMVAPMLPQAPPVHRCGACRSYFWVEAAREVGRMALDADQPHPAEWLAAPMVEDLDASGYLDALDSGLAEVPDQERQLRTLAWWAANDAFRSPHPDFQPDPGAGLPDAARANLARLLDLLDEDEPQTRLMKAEAARELGRFDQALPLLSAQFPPRLQPAAAQIRRLTRQQDPHVRPLDLGAAGRWG